MWYKIIIALVLVLIVFDPIIIIVSGVRKGTYFNSYKYLETNSVRAVFQVFFGIIYDKRIYYNAIETEYSGLMISAEELEKFFEKYNIKNTIQKLQILDHFKLLEEADFDVDKLTKNKKQVLNKIVMYSELKEMYLKRTIKGENNDGSE